MRCRRIGFIVAALAMMSITAASAQNGDDQEPVELTTGKTDKVIDVAQDPDERLSLIPTPSKQNPNVKVPGSFTLDREDYKRLPRMKTNRDLDLKELPVNDGDHIVLFSVRRSLSDKATVAFEPCDSLKVDEGDSEADGEEEDGDEGVNPSWVFCDGSGYLSKGGLVALRTGENEYTPLAQIPRRKAPMVGTDVGIALTILRPDESEEGFKFFEGATMYYSWARLGPVVRPVVNLSALNMDDQEDIETGLGLGFLIRTPGSQNNPNDLGFGLVVGGGYNFMLDGERKPDLNGVRGKKKDPWYWFVGFSWNFNRGNGNGNGNDGNGNDNADS